MNTLKGLLSKFLLVLGPVLVSTESWNYRQHAEEVWLASLKHLDKQINANENSFAMTVEEADALLNSFEFEDAEALAA